ncbi:MAG: hypothetical protein P1R58_02960 [bacterium]|nr:hypothetical protein [bacterium]
MYKIRPTLFGLRITLSEQMDQQEALRFQASLERLVRKYPVSFAAIIDTRNLVPPPENVLKILKDCLVIGKKHRLAKAAIIHSSPEVQSQVHRLSILSEVIDEAREIDARTNENWEKLALNWIMNDVDPNDQGNHTERIQIPTK